MAPSPTETITCPACGRDVERCDAREYDRYGNRWDRTGKTFEYLCKPCHRQTCHLPRDDLEATLCAIETPRAGVEDFITAYYREVRSEPDQQP